MSDTASDAGHLRRALRLAARGRYRTAPNPMVGAVVVRRGEVVGEGYHRRVGGPHAEVEALAQAGDRAAGATLYVTLEPCTHSGRTPPCVPAVLAAGIRRVVVCHRDPNPLVGGRGLARLRRAGLEVSTGGLAEAAVRLNLRYLVPLVLGRSMVTLKWAMSLDGKIATAGGESRWISGAAARRFALELRETHDAVLVGSGTVLADDPRLTRRLGLAGRPGVRVVLDRRLRVPPRARLLREEGEALVYTEPPPAGSRRSSRSATAGRSRERRRRVLEAAGAHVVVLARVEPAAVVADLLARGIRSVLVEGGGEILDAFVAAGVYDRVSAVSAPLLVGGRRAPGPLGGEGAARLATAPRLAGLVSRRRGDDLILTAYRHGCLPELLRSVVA